MDLTLIKKLIRIVEASGITDFEVEQDGVRIKIAKKIRTAQGVSKPYEVLLPPDNGVSGEGKAELKTSASTEEGEKTYEIRSPIVGTFYRAPAPDADPYVQVGDIITKGSVLCIVEAMKFMNEIESDVEGRVIKILVDNGKPVEFNQPLFLIQLA